MCEYCDDSSTDLLHDSIPVSLNGIKVDELQADVFIRFDGRLELYIDSEHEETISLNLLKINFCPMCGRRL